MSERITNKKHLNQIIYIPVDLHIAFDLVNSHCDFFVLKIASDFTEIVYIVKLPYFDILIKRPT